MTETAIFPQNAAQNTVFSFRDWSKKEPVRSSVVSIVAEYTILSQRRQWPRIATTPKYRQNNEEPGKTSVAEWKAQIRH